MKAIRWLLKLVLAMITLPLILAVWLIKRFVVFLHHCSAWTFYLLGSVVLPWEKSCPRLDIGRLTLFMGQSEPAPAYAAAGCDIRTA